MKAGPILIVEDEIFVAMDIERILEEGGYEVAAIAADQSQAREVATNARIAFVDLNLRDGPTGPKIARELSDQGISVVFITANPAQIEDVPGTAIGYLRKPFSESAVLTAAALASGLPVSYHSGEIVRF